MNFIVIVVSLLSAAASPPPQPPTAPAVAQGEFDGYLGPTLWNAWRRATYDAAVSGAEAIHDAHNNDQPGAVIEEEGPRIRQ